MKKGLIFLAGLGLAGCASQPATTATSPAEGKWRLTEIKCEKGDYTKAGQELRDFYTKKGGTRLMEVRGTKIFTKVKGAPDKDGGVCTAEIETVAEWEPSHYTTKESIITKTSTNPKDKECTGERKVLSSGDQRAYTLTGNKLTLWLPNKAKRIEPTDDETICKSSKFVHVYIRR